MLICHSNYPNFESFVQILILRVACIVFGYQNDQNLVRFEEYEDDIIGQKPITWGATSLPLSP